MKWSPSSSLNLILLKVPAFDLLVITSREHVGIFVAYSQACETMIKQILESRSMELCFARIIDEMDGVKIEKG